MISCSSPSAPSCPTPAGGRGNEINRLVDSLRKVRCAQARIIAAHDCADVRGAWVCISLASIPDPQEATGLTIPDADVDALVSSGQQLAEQNVEIRDLISGLDGYAVSITEARRK